MRVVKKSVCTAPFSVFITRSIIWALDYSTVLPEDNKTQAAPGLLSLKPPLQNGCPPAGNSLHGLVLPSSDAEALTYLWSMGAETQRDLIHPFINIYTYIHPQKQQVTLLTTHQATWAPVEALTTSE